MTKDHLETSTNHTSYESNSFYFCCYKKLREHYILDQHAQQIMARVVNDANSMTPWKEPMENYENPEKTSLPIMINIAWHEVKGETLRWMDDNHPHHWAKSLFIETPKQPNKNSHSITPNKLEL